MAKKETVADVVPDVSSVEWTPWVLSQLQEHELNEGLPTRDGLARIAPTILGDILESYPTIQQCPNIDNGMHAVVMWTLQFQKDGGPKRTYADASCVSSLNTSPEYLAHATASACTRAEGRALKKALGLTQIHTAEEVTEGAAEIENMGFINDTQLRYMMMIGLECNINIVKFINSGSQKYKSIREIPYMTAAKMTRELMKYKAKGKIPPEYAGYDKNWCPEISNPKTKEQ